MLRDNFFFVKYFEKLYFSDFIERRYAEDMNQLLHIDIVSCYFLWFTHLFPSFVVLGLDVSSMQDLDESDLTSLFPPVPVRIPPRAGVVVILTSQGSGRLPGSSLRQTQLNARQFNLPPFILSVHHCSLGVSNLDCF